MSRKLITRIAASLAIAAILGSSAADAHGFGGGRVASASLAGRGTGSAPGKLAVLNPGRGGNPNHPGGHGHPGYPGRPIYPGPGHWAHFHHHHWIWRDGIWVDLGVDLPIEAAAPSPCTCLTKTYTPDGLVVFADVCTREAASARVDGAASEATPVPPATGKSSDATPAPAVQTADVTQAPTSPNYAGRTYQDYLAANAQAAAQAPQKN